jgi:hypothetical protein
MGLRPTAGNENQRRRARAGARHGVPLQWPARVILGRAAGDEESCSASAFRARFLAPLSRKNVIPARAGIHSVPGQQWPPAFAGVTTPVIFIPLGGSKTYDHSE